MTPYHKDKSTEIHNGDCLQVLRTLPDSSVDSCVTDPPYGLAFMGKKWDYDVPSSEVWQEVLRVLKPGGHLLAFAGTRTQHRMAVRIEDAGFDIRDMLAWVYGSGFPKSLDVSKAIDKCNGEPHRLHKFTAWMRTTGLTARQLDQITDTNMGGHYLTAASQPAIPTAALWCLIRPHCGEVPAWVDELVQRIEAEREVVGQKIMIDTRKARAGFVGSTHSPEYDGSKRAVNITAPATEAAKQWQGWGTALKPALEPITVARAPLSGTVAANVLEHGTGALNVDGCRVGTEEDTRRNAAGGSNGLNGSNTFKIRERKVTDKEQPTGRFPANLIHDGSDEVAELFPETTSGKMEPTHTKASRAVYGQDAEKGYVTMETYGDSGSAARFFYCAKAGSDERRNSKHPTIKPVALMRYLVRLVCPAGGVVLDPFAGSGTTIEAARLEHCRAIGIEREAEYCADILERLRQGVLF